MREMHSDDGCKVAIDPSRPWMLDNSADEHLGASGMLKDPRTVCVRDDTSDISAFCCNPNKNLHFSKNPLYRLSRFTNRKNRYSSADMKEIRRLVSQQLVTCEPDLSLSSANFLCSSKNSKVCSAPLLYRLAYTSANVKRAYRGFNNSGFSSDSCFARLIDGHLAWTDAVPSAKVRTKIFMRGLNFNVEKCVTHGNKSLEEPDETWKQKIGTFFD